MDKKEESSLSENSPETSLRKTLRGTLRWMIVTLMAFGLGSLAITYALYISAQRKLDEANTDLVDAEVEFNRRIREVRKEAR